jgi:L-ribulose-5-phosphate 3-epimerase
MSDHTRIAVCSWSLQPEDPVDLARKVRETGIRAVQLALNPLIDDPDRWGDAPAALAGAGIEIVSGMMAMAGEDYRTLESIAETGGIRAAATWPENLRIATRCAVLANQLGIDLVTFHAGFIPEMPDDPLRRTLVDRLHVVASSYEQRELSLAFETGQEDADTLVGLLAELGRPVTVGVNFDPANMILYGMGDPVEALRTLGPHVRQIHVKDALPTDTPGTWGTEVPVGQGAVDWEAFFTVAEAFRPRVDYVIEREAGTGRLPDVVAARELIERYTEA